MYFLVELSFEDALIFLTLCRNLNKKPNDFIIESLRTHIEKLQYEWRKSLEQRESKTSIAQVGGST